METFKDSATEFIDMAKIFRHIVRKWYLIVVAGVLAGVIGFCYANFYITPTYRAKSVMLVELRNSHYDEMDYEQVTVAQKYVSTFADIIRTNYVLEDVIKKLNLKESPASLASKIQVYENEDTFLINVTMTHTNPKKALEILQALDDSVVDKVVEKFGSTYVQEWDKPVVTSAPVSPNVSRYTVLGGMAGVVIALALIILIALLNNKVKSVSDLQRMVDIPVLGVVPSLQVSEKSKGGY